LSRGRTAGEIGRHVSCSLIAGSLRSAKVADMIRKLKSGEYRLYSRKADPKTGKRRNLGTFASRAAAEKHEREVQYFKRH
jgi:cell division septation protein DedD